jgi:hypothetical protein
MTDRTSFFNREVKPFYPASPPLEVEAEIRPSAWMGHTLELHLPRATPATFLHQHGALGP